MPDDLTSRIELGDHVVDQFTRLDRPAPAPTIDTTEARTQQRPGNRRPRRHRALAVLGLLALAAAGAACAIPPELYGTVNQGALAHAAEHVAAGAPAAEVLCALGEDQPQGYLVPSAMVVKYGSCRDAILNSVATECDGTNPCRVYGDRSTAPILQLTDQWCHNPQGFPFRYTGPVEATPALCQDGAS